MRERLFCRISLVIGFEHGRLHHRGEALARCVRGLLNRIDVYMRSKRKAMLLRKTSTFLDVTSSRFRVTASRHIFAMKLVYRVVFCFLETCSKCDESRLCYTPTTGEKA